MQPLSGLATSMMVVMMFISTLVAYRPLSSGVADQHPVEVNRVVDSYLPRIIPQHPAHVLIQVHLRDGPLAALGEHAPAVSYTHLTLPTICSV